MNAYTYMHIRTCRWVRQELVRRLAEVAAEYPNGFSGSNGFRSDHAIIRIDGFDPDHEPDHEPDHNRRRRGHGLLEGHCDVRNAKGRRALFFDLTLEVRVGDRATTRGRGRGRVIAMEALA